MKGDRIHNQGHKLVHTASREWLRVGHRASGRSGPVHILQGGTFNPDSVKTNHGAYMAQTLNCCWEEMSQSDLEVANRSSVEYN